MNVRLRALLFAALLSLGPAAFAGESLEARAQELRRTLATQYPPQDRRALVARQLLTSLERRQDLLRAREDAHRLAQAEGGALHPAPPPAGLLAVDALRRDLQQMDEALAGGRIRLGVLQAERVAAATQLEAAAAKSSRLDEAGAPEEERQLARLEAQYAESAVAEIDLITEVVGQQERLATARRQAAAARLARVAQVEASDADRAALARDIDARQARLQLRLAQAAARRDAARAKARANPKDEVAGERLANLDIDMELTREALADLVIEREAWALTLRFRAGDAGALVEARERGPALRERLQRRSDFLQALSAQLLGRLATLQSTAPTTVSPEAATARLALQAVLEERLRRVQDAMQEERQLSALLQRLRDDFDRRASTASLGERFGIAMSELRARCLAAWNLELFSVDEEIEVDGRKTHVAHAVTLGKLVQAPLLLLLGSLLVWWLTGWGARWLQRRRNLDEARVRLLRRWVAIVLLAACLVGSLVLAGIPLAAFAFVGGAVAIGAGFGTQALFKNLLSGVLVLVERPFRLGDVIEVEGLRGTVVDIDLRASVLRDDEGAETLVPNATLIDQKVRNMTLRSRRAKQALSVEVATTASPRAVMEAMRAAANRHGQLLQVPAPEVLLEDCGEGALRFALNYWIELKPGVERKRIASDLRLMVLGAFEEGGIALAPRKAA